MVAHDDEAIDRDADLADQDDDRHPPRKLTENREPHEGEAGQHLVGDGVEQLAEIGELLVALGYSDEDAAAALKPFGGLDNMTQAQAAVAIEKFSQEVS